MQNHISHKLLTDMKHLKLFYAAALLLCCLSVSAKPKQDGIKWSSVDALELNLIGKALPTTQPYHRIDTTVYKGFTVSENSQCRMTSGLAILFRTNASTIAVKPVFGDVFRTDPLRSYRGFDLYIIKDSKWLWAGQTCFGTSTRTPDKNVVVKNMDDSMKECILYLPLFCELSSLEVLVPEGSVIEKMESPFTKRVVFHGSSFTHGHSCTRAGMSYPMQFMRRTGLQVVPLGFSGNCKMQPYFLNFLKDVEADAYVFDSFSNPLAPMIKDRLLDFIDGLVAAHPGKPLIFQRTIYWEMDNFDLVHRKETLDRKAMSDSLMKIACKKYKDVYYITPDAALHNGESSTADGVHPNDNGYSVWEASIEKPILKILAKYGIKAHPMQ